MCDGRIEEILEVLLPPPDNVPSRGQQPPTPCKQCWRSTASSTEAHVYACLKCVKPFSEVASLQEKVKTQLCSCMTANAHSFHSHIFVGMQTDDKLWRSLDFEHHVF
ncbi:hypothetical protein AMECASPLE_024206 [Ameca splendens]|uniref:Uncharacterized protein n=1 Tax=Ameca splendens TaxID=208324 RepID=A0ABV0YFU3_9TELE